MIKPPSIRNNSHFRIISTARKIDRVAVDPLIEDIQSRGFRVSTGNHLYGQNHQFSGSLKERVADLQASIDDDDVDVIWCARGGYGSISLIDHISFDNLLHRPKWLVGYSDITGLLNHLHRLGVASVHGPMPINYASDVDLSGFKNLFHYLSGGELQYNLSDHPLNRPGNFSGELIGGNLSIMYSILGSSSCPDPRGKILFLEDLDEYLYHIDRMMLNMSRNNMLKNLSGMIIGGMTEMNDNDIPFGKSAEQIIRDYVSDYNYPVYFGFPAGHVSPNQPLPIGVAAKIEESVLTFSS